MKTLHAILALAGLMVVVLAVFVFTSSNPGTMVLDVGVARLESVPIGVAFAAAFAVGWAVGMLCMLYTVLRGVHERRRLKRRLRHTENELRGLRDFPADTVR